MTVKEYDEKDIKKFYDISEILYNLDPANTMCNVNDAHDEYDREAKQILDIYMTNKEITKSDIVKVFDESFDEDYDRTILNDAYDWIVAGVFA